MSRERTVPATSRKRVVQWSFHFHSAIVLVFACVVVLDRFSGAYAPAHGAG